MSEAPRLTKRCRTCGRFRSYAADDTYCLVCGYQSLDAACACGRGFDYALDEPPEGALHCPRCGRDLRADRRSLGLE